jgi:glutathione S-transferase
MSTAGAGNRLVLFGAGTARTLRAHWALHELGLDYEPRLVASRSGETATADFGRLNPKRKIPVLVDGDFTLTESAAIVNYLGDTYGHGAGRPGVRLVPDPGTRERARYDEACFFVMTELDAHTLYVVRRHRDLAALYGEAPNAVSEALAGFDRQVSTVEAALGDGRRHLLGDLFTGADILLASCLQWATFYGRPLSERLSAYLGRVTQRPAHGRAAAINYSILPDGSPRK